MQEVIGKKVISYAACDRWNIPTYLALPDGMPTRICPWWLSYTAICMRGLF
ncbi:hypothetical protein [Undibacterium sp. TJN19]|uniref:hypothetical protein n=1 Tax=Undibacterium sp. TJN19 TaxID=3413055 RepID=UPI003BEFAA72